jgi:pyruvate dehydrogenase E2 component (dihydrolipoamide acetyltransferase)
VALEIKMPKLGMTMEEGQIVEWLKSEKETVAAGEILFTIESDKVTFEVESPGSGILSILMPAGETVPVGTVLGLLAETEHEYSLLASKAPAEALVEGSEIFGETTAIDAERTTGGIQPPRVRATPGARKLARQRGLDLALVRGTGPEGRVTKVDVIKAIETAPDVSGEKALPAAPTAPVAGPRRVPMKEAPLNSMRATISRRMIASLQSAAQMTAFAEWDLSELLRLRKIINESQVPPQSRVTIPGIIAFFLARVLKEMPIFNASIEGNVVKYWKDVNIGVAVAVEDGLVVPVLHGADRKSLNRLQQHLDQLIERARGRRLLPDDMAGGTFTLSNLGSYGSEWETVILNPPEVALLGIGRVAPKPVVVGNEIVVRQMMPVSLTFDHRLIDGAAAGAFRQRMKGLVENPGLLITCFHRDESGFPETGKRMERDG